MNDWENQANASLRSLADARQRGQLDRAEYRERRRRILQAGRNRQAQTQPNALQPTKAAVAATDARKNSSVWKLATLALALLAGGLLIWLLRE